MLEDESWLEYVYPELDNGSYVHEGDLIAELENSNLNTQLDNAKLNIDNAQISKRNAENNLSSSRKQLDNYNITSPISGKIVFKNLKKGDVISTYQQNASNIMAIVADVSTMKFEMQVDELLSGEEQTIQEKAEETLPISRSDSDAGIYGFVTDVSHKQTGTELEIKDWGYALEDKTKKLGFEGRLRSQILEEVIKSYGLIPIVDFTGLRDDIITWNNITSSDEEDDSGGTGGKIIGNDAIEIGNSLASNYGFCADSGSENYETMKSKGCGSCWAWSDALFTELTKIGYTCRIVQYATNQSPKESF